MDLYILVIGLLILSELFVLLIILTSLSMICKYNLLGSYRITTQLISFHLLFSTIFILLFSIYDFISYIFNFILPSIL